MFWNPWKKKKVFCGKKGWEENLALVIYEFWE